MELAGTSALEYIKYKTLTRICCRSLRRREKDIFEELEKEEDDVDKMIDDYVAQQVEEDKKPKQERPKPKPRDELYKIGLPGKLILSKRKGLLEVLVSLK